MVANVTIYTVQELVDQGVIAKPLDGNHGGIHPKGSDFVESGIPFIMASDLKDGEVDTVGCKFISPEQAKTLRKGFAKEGDVLLSHKATIGRTAIVGKLDTEYIVLTPQVTYYRVLDESKINLKYLKYYFDSVEFQNLFEQWAGGGSTRLYLGITGQMKLPIKLPDIEVQNSIVSIIDSFDSRIILNRQTNQTLEQMAQALFKSWFVDFDPVIDNALAAGNDIPDALQHKAEQRKQAHQLPDFKALPDNIRALFPSEFEQTGEVKVGIEGWIPKGWKSKTVSEAIIINPRVSIPKGTVAKFADMKAVPTSGYMISEVIEKEFKGGAKFQKNDVILARITPCLENGKTALVDFLQDDEAGFGSTEFIVLRENGVVSYLFIACLARDDNFRQHCIQNMVGSSGRQRVQNSCFDFYHLALPENKQILNTFKELTKPSFDKMIINKDEINALSKLRDTLLPKLISGELQLPDTEQQAEYQ